ncbi:MAG: hypothetical protein RLZZ543_431 [Bacteroidota bacterium]|jgi:hypothetical protein
MIVSITKIELRSYSQLRAFFAFNQRIIQALQKAPCKGFKATGSWNLKCWYTMTVWENENDLKLFYKQGVHLEAMKKASHFSHKIQSKRLVRDDVPSWKEAKKLFI